MTLPYPEILTRRARRNLRRKMLTAWCTEGDTGAALDCPLLKSIIRTNDDGSRIAIYSPCRKYRYALLVNWDRNQPLRVVIGLNPSTATEDVNDPTVSQCINRAKRENHGGLLMLNLFPFRATDPKAMKAAQDPEGGQTPDVLIDLIDQALLFRGAHTGGGVLQTTLAAWGNHGAHRGMSQRVCDVFTRRGMPLYALQITKTGEPSHPLYKPAELKLTRYRRGVDYLDTMRRSAAA